jgi:competence protein ComGC
MNFKMTKEQFKNSIVNLINYYTQNAVQYNLNAKDVQDQGMEGMMSMIQSQMSALNYGFEQGLEELLNEVFPEEENEDTEEEETVE